MLIAIALALAIAYMVTNPTGKDGKKINKKVTQNIYAERMVSQLDKKAEKMKPMN